MLFDCRNLDLKVGQTVFFYADGKREVITGGKHARITSQIKPEPEKTVTKVSQVLPKPKAAKLEDSVTDNLLKCEICGKGFAAKRKDARCCSDKCRQILHRKHNKKQMVLVGIK